MEIEILKRKALVFNVIEFLTSEMNNTLLPDERKESIEVAIQCLETAYEITSEERESLYKIDLLSNIRVTSTDITNERIQVAEFHKNLGNVAMKNSNFEDAVSEYTKAITSYPKNAVYYCNRAAAHSRLENDEAAVKDCKQALLYNPTYGKAYGRLGIAHSNLNQWREAVRAFEYSIRYEPHNESFHANLRMARDKMYATMENAAPPQHRPIDITQFINNEAFLSMAREMMANPDFQSIMSGIMAMSQSGDTNFEALFQAGQTLASRMQDEDPCFVENLRRHFEPRSGPRGRRHHDREDGCSGEDF